MAKPINDNKGVFIPKHKPSRTESLESDLIIDRKGKRKKPFLTSK